MRFAWKDTYVLMIGASQYNDAYLDDIPNIDVNFRQLKKALKNPEILGLPEANILQAKNMNYEATMQTIDKAFRYANHKSKTIIVYYAGHGLIDQKNGLDFYLATKTVDKDSPYVGGIKGEHIAHLFKHSHAGRKIFLIDACYSGRLLGLMSSYSEIIRKNFDKAILSNDRISGTYAMASTSANLPSNFPVENPKAPTYFSGKLIEIMTGGLEFANEFLTLNDIYFQIENDFTDKKLPLPMKMNRETADNYRFVYNRKFSTERKNYEILRRNPTVNGLINFINSTKNDKLRADAEESLNKLREENAWRRVKRKDTEQAYKSFVNKFPKGAYKNEAIQQLKYFDDTEAWQKTKRYNTIDAYRNYLKSYPHGINVKAARNRIKHIKDENAWEICLATNDKAAFFEYLYTYPSGLHLEEAILKMSSFKPEVKKQAKNYFKSRSMERSYSLVVNAEIKEYKAQFTDAQHLYEQALKETPAHPYIKDKLSQMAEILLRNKKNSIEKRGKYDFSRIALFVGIIIIFLLIGYVFLETISGNTGKHQRYLWQEAHNYVQQKKYSEAYSKMKELALSSKADSVLEYKALCRERGEEQNLQQSKLVGKFQQNIVARRFASALKNLNTLKNISPAYKNISSMEKRYQKAINGYINRLIHQADILSNNEKTYLKSEKIYLRVLGLSPNNLLVKNRILELGKIINKAFELHMARANDLMKSNIGHKDALEQIEKALLLKPDNIEAKARLKKLKYIK